MLDHTYEVYLLVAYQWSKQGAVNVPVYRDTEVEICLDRKGRIHVRLTGEAQSAFSQWAEAATKFARSTLVATDPHTCMLCFAPR